MKLKEALKFMLIFGCIATTFQTLFISAAALHYGNNSFQAVQMYRLPLIGFASTIPILIFVTKGTPARIELVIRKILHFILTASIVFGLLIHFEWVEAKTALPTALFFLGVYICGYILTEIRDKKTAVQINAKIQAENATYNAENATCDN
ncbi:MAG: DUF3021 family protein [Oscillospiraceae bacterium]|nr:DUF3021 family protein [Oscillospiraceae bacterium]